MSLEQELAGPEPFTHEELTGARRLKSVLVYSPQINLICAEINSHIVLYRPIYALSLG